MECPDPAGDERPTCSAALIGRDHEIRQLRALLDAMVRLTRLLQVSPMVLLSAIDEVLASGLLTGDNEMVAIPRPAVAPREEHARLNRRPARYPPPARRTTPARPASIAPAHRVVDWRLLTAREREIADLVGRALTNRQIATRIGRSPHTVNYHLRQIFQKLGITSRVGLAALLRQAEEAGGQVGGQ